MDDLYEDLSEDARAIAESIEHVFFLLVKQAMAHRGRESLSAVVDHIRKRAAALYCNDFWRDHLKGFDIRAAISRVAERVLERMEKTYGVHEGPRTPSGEAGEEA